MNTKLLNSLFGGMQSVGRRTFVTTAAVLSIAGVASAQHTLGLKLGQNGNGNQQGTAAGALQPGDLAGAPGYGQTNWNVLGRFGNNDTNATSFGTNTYPLLDSNGDDAHVTIQWDATGNWSVQGSGTPTYQQVPLTSNNGRVAGSGNYTVFTGLSDDSLLVRTAEFNTRCGINAIQIIPRAAPIGATIDPLPASQTYAGGRAVFRAKVAGVVPMSFHWQMTGSPLSDAGHISGWT